IQAARLMTLDAARAMDEGSEARVEIALIKFWGARVLHDMIDRAIQVHGALGVTADTPLEFMYREARYARLYDGPDEVHRMVVARRLLRHPIGGTPWAQDRQSTLARRAARPTGHRGLSEWAARDVRRTHDDDARTDRPGHRALCRRDVHLRGRPGCAVPCRGNRSARWQRLRLRPLRPAPRRA